jgi:signal transduction histidine kinase
LLDPLTHLLLYNLMALMVGLLSAKAHRNLSHFKQASTELSQAYEELKNSSESLKRSERLAALGQLSAGIAHEIRNPLGSIKGAVDILTSDIPEEHPKEEFVGIVRKEVSRINKLVEEFLRFARPPRPEITPVNLSDLVSGAVRLVEGYASRNGIQIQRLGNDRTVEVDEDQMRQVLLNLLLNAIEAMPEGGTLRIEFEGDGERETTLLRISDTGNGVEKVELDQIFDPFYTTKPHGTGLGLSISHQLVRNHGGQIAAEINRQRGLTVTIELPAATSERL